MPDARLRPIGPGDRHALRLAFARMSPDARYARWLAPRRELGEDELDALVAADGWHHHGVLAWAPDRHLPIGFGSCVRTARFCVAEIAVAVIDERQRTGVGGQLVQALAQSARSTGIDTLVACTHAENVAARRLLRGLGPARTITGRSGALEIAVALAPGAR